MKYLSICSGIEAASVAWHPLGWEPLGFSEIMPFPNALLEQRWPAVPNFGNMLHHGQWTNSIRPRLIVAGTPCQAFSVAGFRRGLDDPRGNLTLGFLGIVEQYRPEWVLWENVPGILYESTGAFGSFLGGLGKLGYGFAYRILDAQYFGVPQRRRRVFVVANLRDWRRAAAVLFEFESMRGDSPPSRGTGQGVAGTLGGSTQSGGFRTTDLDNNGAFIPERSNPLTHRMDKGANTTLDEGQTLIAHPLRAQHCPSHRDDSDTYIAEPVAFDSKGDGVGAGPTAPTLRAMTADGGRMNGGGQLAIAFDTTQLTNPENRSNPQPGAPCHSLAESAKPPALAFSNCGGETNLGLSEEHTPPVTGSNRNPGSVIHDWRVRRLTPIECERLQGFPDGYTQIEWRGKPWHKCPDGHRYKALGNSMAVPVMQWLGRRVELIDSIS